MFRPYFTKLKNGKVRVQFRDEGKVKYLGVYANIHHATVAFEDHLQGRAISVPRLKRVFEDKALGIPKHISLCQTGRNAGRYNFTAPREKNDTRISLWVDSLYDAVKARNEWFEKKKIPLPDDITPFDQDNLPPGLFGHKVSKTTKVEPTRETKAVTRKPPVTTVTTTVTNKRPVRTKRVPARYK
jgi:hypothetical protein